MKAYCQFQRDLLPKNGKDLQIISVILMVIFKNYISVSIYNSLVTNKNVTSYSSAYQSPYNSLGEFPVVVDHTIIFGWMLSLGTLFFITKQVFLPLPKMLIVNKANPNAS